MVPARLLVLVSTLGAAASAQQPVVSYVQLGQRIGCTRDVVLADFDRDGRDDLIIAVGSCGDEILPGGRRIEIHLKRKQRPYFSLTPDRVLALVPDVIAFAVADVHPNPGAEIVLFSATRAVAVFWEKGRKEPRYAAVARTTLLFQPASPRDVFEIQECVQDLDGDGKDELVVPEPGGYRLVFPWNKDRNSVIELPPARATARERAASRFLGQRESLKIGITTTSSRSRGNLIDVHDILPPPRFIDWDGDGDRDLCALSGQQLLVWLQGADGKFSAKPAFAEDLPRQRGTIVDFTFSAQAGDLDGDKRAEVLIVYSHSQDNEVQSTVEVYRQHGDDEPMFDKPAEKLRLQGFCNEPRLQDVDGDNKPDLVIGTLRPDVLDALTSGGGKTFEGQINLFRSRFTATGGRFQRPVALVHKVTVPARNLRERRSLLASFFFDVDRNGLRDLLMRMHFERLEVLPTSTRGRRFEVGDPIWNLSINPGAKVRVFSDDKHAVIVVREPRQVIHVEFR